MYLGLWSYDMEPDPCPTAQEKNSVQLCPGLENVHTASSRNLMVNAAISEIQRARFRSVMVMAMVGQAD
ncbi:hypothetical protein PAAG_11312 [Paracoccidioides lutzii Pb01]|uniref:Uncharacterized protein n=1 Tax=Paracoccidioides lutzii (strain ATCC MYA-826 / Pb01) TaxID=502779 RepID=A0A0A2V6E2_PARBA|nr:hypothetical protein PAAG_11312 [Paracoccidioides lutzii Pb01]KGQ01922.1 hypothetical protein PAAG_11312 [Paracoccidioides lutzii Pb01]